MDKSGIQVDPRFETKRARSQWGTSRTLIKHLITGVTKGFEQKLEITGVATARRCRARTCSFNSATAMMWSIRSPKGSRSWRRTDRNHDHRSDKQRVGQVAAEIRDFRPPEPYKGKGVKYAGE